MTGESSKTRGHDRAIPLEWGGFWKSFHGWFLHALAGRVAVLPYLTCYRLNTTKLRYSSNIELFCLGSILHSGRRKWKRNCKRKAPMPHMTHVYVESCPTQSVWCLAIMANASNDADFQHDCWRSVHYCNHCAQILHITYISSHKNIKSKYTKAMEWIGPSSIFHNGWFTKNKKYSK